MASTYIFLLLMDVADLEPYILLGQWPRRVLHDVFEALEWCQNSG